MKKLLFIGSICAALFSIYSCNNNSNADTHVHDDGTVHEAHDTTKPVQQEFNVADTSKKDTSAHTHDEGKKHTH